MKLQNPFGISLDRLMFFGIGAGLTVLCSFLRLSVFEVAVESHWIDGVYNGYFASGRCLRFL